MKYFVIVLLGSLISGCQKSSSDSTPDPRPASTFDESSFDRLTAFTVEKEISLQEMNELQDSWSPDYCKNNPDDLPADELQIGQEWQSEESVAIDGKKRSVQITTSKLTVKEELKLVFENVMNHSQYNFDDYSGPKYQNTPFYLFYTRPENNSYAAWTRKEDQPLLTEAYKKAFGEPSKEESQAPDSEADFVCKVENQTKQNKILKGIYKFQGHDLAAIMEIDSSSYTRICNKANVVVENSKETDKHLSIFVERLISKSPNSCFWGNKILRRYLGITKNEEYSLVYNSQEAVINAPIRAKKSNKTEAFH